MRPGVSMPMVAPTFLMLALEARAYLLVSMLMASFVAKIPPVTASLMVYLLIHMASLVVTLVGVLFLVKPIGLTLSAMLLQSMCLSTLGMLSRPVLLQHLVVQLPDADKLPVLRMRISGGILNPTPLGQALSPPSKISKTAVV